LLAVLAASLSFGVAAALASSFLFTSHWGAVCDSNPCTTYHDYGWPLEWRTNAPAWLIRSVEADEGTFYYIASIGVSPISFLADVIFWSAPVAIVGGLLLLGRFGWSRIRRRHDPTRGP
jgi:hypothetical protein